MQNKQPNVPLSDMNDQNIHQNYYNLFSNMFGHMVKVNNNQTEILTDVVGALKSTVATNLSISKSSTDMAKSTSDMAISTFNYVLSNYITSPVLRTLDDYSIIKNHLSDDKFVELLIFNYNHNSLISYLGDFIIKQYKKDDPHDQSLWNSDTTRLTYIKREELKNKENTWIRDKHGKNTIKCIVTPLLEYIKPLVTSYWTRKNEYIRNNNTGYCSMDNEIAYQTVAFKIEELLRNDNLKDNIIKYMAPYFYLPISTISTVKVEEVNDTHQTNNKTVQQITNVCDDDDGDDDDDDDDNDDDGDNDDDDEIKEEDNILDSSSEESEKKKKIKKIKKIKKKTKKLNKKINIKTNKQSNKIKDTTKIQNIKKSIANSTIRHEICAVQPSIPNKSSQKTKKPTCGIVQKTLAKYVDSDDDKLLSDDDNGSEFVDSDNENIINKKVKSDSKEKAPYKKNKK